MQQFINVGDRLIPVSRLISEFTEFFSPVSWPVSREEAIREFKRVQRKLWFIQHIGVKS